MIINISPIFQQAHLPHGTGQTILREAFLIADHAAYHTGEIVLVRRLLHAWK